MPDALAIYCAHTGREAACFWPTPAAQVSHLDRELRAKLSQAVRSLFPPPTDAPPS